MGDCFFPLVAPANCAGGVAVHDGPAEQVGGTCAGASVLGEIKSPRCPAQVCRGAGRWQCLTRHREMASAVGAPVVNGSNVSDSFQESFGKGVTERLTTCSGVLQLTVVTLRQQSVSCSKRREKVSPQRLIYL